MNREEEQDLLNVYFYVFLSQGGGGSLNVHLGSLLAHSKAWTFPFHIHPGWNDTIMKSSSYSDSCVFYIE